jgi:hypothetical protein
MVMLCLNKKVVGLICVFIVVSVLFLSVLLVTPCVAVDVVKPMVPSFTVQEVAQPYDVPPSTVTIVDPYTGEETITTYPGYTVENKTIYLVVKNQPFTPYKNGKGEMMNLYYYYAYRGHYYEGGGGWSWGRFQYYAQSDSEYTFIHFDGTIPSNGKIDIKVRALVGTLSLRNPIPGLDSSGNFYFSFEGVEGDYSYVTVSRDMILSTTWPSSSVFPTSSENPDPSTSDDFHSPPSQQSPWATYLLIVIATVCIITIPIAIVMYHNKRQQRKTKFHNTNQDKIL